MTSDDTRASADAADATSSDPGTSAATADTKPTKPARKQRDPEDVELRFTGDPAIGMNGVPAADLTRADIDRITYRRTVPEPGTRGLSRGQRGFSEKRQQVVRDLVATGKFSKRGH